MTYAELALASGLAPDFTVGTVLTVMAVALALVFAYVLSTPR